MWWERRPNAQGRAHRKDKQLYKLYVEDPNDASGDESLSPSQSALVLETDDESVAVSAFDAVVEVFKSHDKQLPFKCSVILSDGNEPIREWYHDD